MFFLFVLLCTAYAQTSTTNCFRCASKANFNKIVECLDRGDKIIVYGIETTPIQWYDGHLDTYMPPLLTDMYQIDNITVATCEQNEDRYRLAGSFDIVMASAPRKDNPPYLRKVLDAYSNMLDKSQQIFVGWDETKEHNVLLNIQKESRYYLQLLPIGHVVDPYPDTPPLTKQTLTFGTESRSRIQTETLLRVLEASAQKSNAPLLLITEDDFVPCDGFVQNLLDDLAKIKNDFTSYRCAYGLGCLIIQRKDVVAFVKWARINIAVTAVDTLSSVFFAKESIQGKWIRHNKLGGHVYFDIKRRNFVKQFLGTIHIGVQSTFSSAYHAETLSQVEQKKCYESYDTRSPVEYNGIWLDKFNASCSRHFCSPCTELL